MLDSSELFHLAQERFGKHGIKVDGLELDLAAMLARKDEVVKGLTDGVRFLFQQEPDRDDLRDRPRQLADLGSGRAERGGQRRPRDAATSCWRPGSSRRACRSCRSTAGRSSIRPGRLRSTRFPTTWSSSAPATSGSSWARSGNGWGRRSP